MRERPCAGRPALEGGDPFLPAPALTEEAPLSRTTSTTSALQVPRRRRTHLQRAIERRRKLAIRLELNCAVAASLDGMCWCAGRGGFVEKRCRACPPHRAPTAPTAIPLRRPFRRSPAAKQLPALPLPASPPSPRAFLPAALAPLHAARAPPRGQIAD
eukprot:365179-Chlamydomonas_euryale.AAC.8